MFVSVSTKINSANDVIVRQVLIFCMLDTAQLITPFNVLWSHNVAHNYDHATFNVDGCYDILQQLSVSICPLRHLLNFTAYITPNSQPLHIFYDC
jgi:hypothetical protein